MYKHLRQVCKGGSKVRIRYYPKTYEMEIEFKNWGFGFTTPRPPHFWFWKGE